MLYVHGPNHTVTAPRLAGWLLARIDGGRQPADLVHELREHHRDAETVLTGMLQDLYAREFIV